jgi:hypothetical protein
MPKLLPTSSSRRPLQSDLVGGSHPQQCYRRFKRPQYGKVKDQGNFQTTFFHLGGFMSTAFVICANDSVEGVVVDYEDLAQEVLLKLKQDHYTKVKHGFRDYAEYSNLVYWHIHTVNVYTQEEL